VRLSEKPSQLKNSHPLLTNGFQVSGFGWQFRAAFPISPCVPSACRVVGLAKADPIFGTSARDRTTDKRAKACTLRCQPAKPKNRAARGSYPSGLRFPFGYVVCGSSPHWLAMFDGTSAPSGLEAFPYHTNGFPGCGFREMCAKPRIYFSLGSGRADLPGLVNRWALCFPLSQEFG